MVVIKNKDIKIIKLEKSSVKHLYIKDCKIHLLEINVDLNNLILINCDIDYIYIKWRDIYNMIIINCKIFSMSNALQFADDENNILEAIMDNSYIKNSIIEGYDFHYVIIYKIKLKNSKIIKKTPNQYNFHKSFEKETFYNII